MADDIRVVNRYSVLPGNLDEVKRLLRLLVERVRSEDPGTMSYEWYLGDNEGDLYLVGQWRDSKAPIAHEALFAQDPLVSEFHEKAPLSRSELFGNMSDELARLLPGIKAVKSWNGFTR